jgi:DNA-binding NarL/FixJ family response regulator
VSCTLSEIDDFVVVGEGASADDAATLAASHGPDVLLLDVSMPGGGIDAISEILARSPQTKVLMLTASEEVEPLVAALRRGAAGYVVKVSEHANLQRPFEQSLEAPGSSRLPCGPGWSRKVSSSNGLQ